MPERARIWVADDDASLLWVLERALTGAGLAVTTFDDAGSLLAALEHDRPSVVITDVRMPGTSGLELARHLRDTCPDLPVIVMTAHSDLDTTVAAFAGGAFEYLAKPFDLDDAIAMVRRALEAEPDEAAAAEPPRETEEANLLGQSAAMQGLFQAIGRLSRAPVTVLITGESGTGKERVAQALHRHSPRAAGPFIALNMAAIPRELLESELFGHVRGAFTGADRDRIGRFEQADGGTLFLDEIGDMPPEAQTRLLRVLAEGSFYRVGDRMPRRVDVRVIAATHQDLQQRVREGGFREDLFHRLNVVHLRVPPLRERREDIPLLARHFLQRSAIELGVEGKRLTAAAERRLQGVDWPGNVRELENLCRWLTVMAPGSTVRPADLPPELAAANDGAAPSPAWLEAFTAWVDQRLATDAEDIANEARAEFERVLIRRALGHTGGHRQEAARHLGWGRNTLTRRMRALGLEEGS